MAEFTPGPWKVGRVGAVVSEVPENSTTERPSALTPDDPYGLEYYGGYLICESVTAPNAKLIAAAPDLYAACKLALDWAGEALDTVFVHRMREAVARAEGRDSDD